MKPHRSKPPVGPELRLLLACAQAQPSETSGPEIRKLLGAGINWTRFVRKAVDHGIAGLVGHVLTRAAPDMVPDDIAGALSINREQAHRRNRKLFLELAGLIEALASAGIEAIAYQGPVLLIRAHGDLGLRTIEHARILVRDADFDAAMAALRDRGYDRRRQLTAAQLDLIRRLQGSELLSNKALGIGFDLHTRLAPMRVTLDVEHEGLWHRALRAALNRRSLLLLAPEDELTALAIAGGVDGWWNIGWASDAAAFIGSHPHLDWPSIVGRAQAQGCRRMVLLAIALLRTVLDASIPEAIAIADPAIAPMIRRILAQWQADDPLGSAGDGRVSLGWSRLHDTTAQRVRYVVRDLLLPTPQHVARMKLPASVTGLLPYIPLKVAHDVAMLPLLRACRGLRAGAERLGYALADYRLARAILPMPAKARHELQRHRQARARAQAMLAVNPGDLPAWRELGDALFGLRRYPQAIACYDKAIELAPDSPELWNSRAAVFRLGKRAGLADIREDPEPDPQDAKAWTRRAGFCSAAQRFAEAAAASDRALAIDPDQRTARRIGIRTRLICCDWTRRDDDERRIADGLRAGLPIIGPFNHRAVSDSEAHNLLAAQIWARGVAQPSSPLWRGERYRHDRFRVAYLCGEFYDHPTGRDIVGVFEHHDKTRFEITAISLGLRAAGEIRDRIESAADRFIEVAGMTDAQVATMMRGMEIDIAIDLNGHAGSGRPRVLAQRPAPVQAGYLGNAGTSGAPFLDYIIADRTVIPEQHARYYTENVIYLPDCYKCSDSRRQIPDTTLSRADADLPEPGFVYCCFNSNYKFTPVMFDVWMRLLSACPVSVLWLLGDEPDTVRNLRREVVARGVAPERLVFAQRLPLADHLARLRLADLFLDTLPVNAHATASDALWAGLPVLTCLGNTFGGRVGASLLRALGLPQMVTASLAEYEALAAALSADPERLARIKAELARNRNTEQLFDMGRLTRDLEAAYTRMWTRLHDGLPPASFAVDHASHDDPAQPASQS